VVQEVEKIVEKTVEVNVLSDEDKAALASYKRQLKEKRDATIKMIMDNSEGVWAVEDLIAMKDDVLTKVSSLIKKPETADYSLNANAYSSIAPVESLYPAGVIIKK
jgi:hypothetical protein